MSLIKSWVKSANASDGNFPLNNLPYGVFSVAGDEPRCCVAIGDMVLDLAQLEADGLLSVSDEPVFALPFLNEFMELGQEAWADVRAKLQVLLKQTSMPVATTPPMWEQCSEEQKMLYRQTGYTFQLDTTGAHPLWWSRGPTFADL